MIDHAGVMLLARASFSILQSAQIRSVFGCQDIFVHFLFFYF